MNYSVLYEVVEKTSDSIKFKVDRMTTDIKLNKNAFNMNLKEYLNTLPKISDDVKYPYKYSSFDKNDILTVSIFDKDKIFIKNIKQFEYDSNIGLFLDSINNELILNKTIYIDHIDEIEEKLDFIDLVTISKNFIAGSIFCNDVEVQQQLSDIKKSKTKAIRKYLNKLCEKVKLEQVFIGPNNDQSLIRFLKNMNKPIEFYSDIVSRLLLNNLNGNNKFDIYDLFDCEFIEEDLQYVYSNNYCIVKAFDMIKFTINPTKNNFTFFLKMFHNGLKDFDCVKNINDKLLNIIPHL